MRGRSLVRTLTAHVRTWRPYTLWYAGLVGLAGAALATSDHNRVQLTAAWAAPTLVWVAAHYLGDYLDRDLDAISKPQRPIPSGLISPGTALACGALLALGACVFALLTDWISIFILAGGIAGALAYNGFFKARGIWGNLVRGILTGAAFYFGELMATTHPPLKFLPFALMFWIHDASSNLVGTTRDVAGDREGGYVTFAVRHGTQVAARTAAGLYALALGIGVAGVCVVPWARAGYLLTLLIAAALGCYAFRLLFSAGQAMTARRALCSHEVLVVERLVLASAVLVPGLGMPVTAAILVPALVITAVTQRLMRSRHEFLPEADGSRAAPSPAQHTFPAYNPDTAN